MEAAWPGKRLCLASALGECCCCLLALELRETLPVETASICRHGAAKFLLANR